MYASEIKPPRWAKDVCLWNHTSRWPMFNSEPSINDSYRANCEVAKQWAIFWIIDNLINSAECILSLWLCILNLWECYLKKIKYQVTDQKNPTLFLCHIICYDVFKCLVTTYKDSDTKGKPRVQILINKTTVFLALSCQLLISLILF